MHFDKNDLDNPKFLFEYNYVLILYHDVQLKALKD